MKKRLISVVMTLMILTGTAMAVTYNCVDASYPVVVNGTAMTFADTKPMNYNGSTLLPLRAMAEALGVPIEWANGQVEITTIDLEALKDACVMLYTGTGGKYTGQGSGVLIDYDEILTCFHVVDGDTIYTAYYDDSTTGQDCTLADTAEAEDAAVLTPLDKSVKPVKIGDSDEVQVGDVVYIVSSPDEKKNVVTSGIVTKTGISSLGAYVLVTTAKVQNGSSGGACFNIKGELIGLIISGTDDNQSCVVPINDIRESLTS